MLKRFYRKRIVRTAAIQGLGRLNSEAIKILTPLLPYRRFVDTVLSPLLPLVFRLQFWYCYSFCPVNIDTEESLDLAKNMSEKYVLALPKGRILDQILPILDHAGLHLEDAFFDSKDRRLRFATNDPKLDVIRVRSFDVATFLAYGAAQMAVAGSDILMEFDHPEIYAPIDLQVGKCRLAVASPVAFAQEDDPKSWSHLRVATKYPHVTAQHFANRGVQAECIKLNGAMELAPGMGLKSTTRGL